MMVDQLQEQDTACPATDAEFADRDRRNLKTHAILVVEDDIKLLCLTTKVLRDAGYLVTPARNAREAMISLRTVAITYDAIVSDINLGEGSSGWDVARFAHGCNAATGIIYVSSECELDWPYQGLPNSIFLQKPITAQRLVQTLAMITRNQPLSWSAI